MTSSTNPKTALEQFQSLALVEHRWMPDQGYLVLVLDRDADGGIFDLLEIAEHFEMDGEIRLVTDFLYAGEPRRQSTSIVDRVEPPVS